MAIRLDWTQTEKGSPVRGMLDYVEHMENDDLKSKPGHVSTVHKDTDGHLIIGYGSTYTRGMPSNMDHATAEKHLVADLKESENYILSQHVFKDEVLKNMHPHQLAVMVGLFQNISSPQGRERLTQSSLITDINNGITDPAKIQQDFLKLSHAGGKFYPGLFKRRLNEASLWAHDPKDLANFKWMDTDNQHYKDALKGHVHSDPQTAKSLPISPHRGPHKKLDHSLAHAHHHPHANDHLHTGHVHRQQRLAQREFNPFG